MTVKMKIIVGAIGALVVLLLMILWATFAWFDKTPIDPLINQIGALITIVVGLISAFFGHQAATSGTPEQVGFAVPGVALSTALAPLPLSITQARPDVPADGEAPQAVASAAPAPMLQ